MSSTPLIPADVQFSSAGQQCSAWWYRPEGSGPFATIVMAHGLGGTREQRLPAFAERFSEAGYACLVFDYRHFGASEGEPRQILDIQKQLADWKAAIAYVRDRSDADRNRIVLWGTSFAGGHVLATAAEDDQIAAVISQCPFTDGLASGLAMDPMTSLKLTALALRDRVGSWLGADPVMVKLAGRPGELALMNAPDAASGYTAVRDGSDAPEHVAARIALDIVRYYPGRQVRNIKARILFCVCDSDTVAPAPRTLKHAKHAPDKDIKCYPDGHFDIYSGGPFEQVVNDQIAFLHQTVPAN
ncbi:alpha/beta hydrolase [Marinobacter mangrovi]|uniref:alpha/beta hydrolase n=1 Tax=Marinobacter mangrovi TaxID=2803918 RepID=UPI001932A67D|nr:alpha/beta fold hydrolase [Marinobacter mangrovi]